MDTAGLWIAYATAPRKTASDVGDDGSPYAKTLAEEIMKPGVEAVTMFRNVQLRVKRTIGQDPWLSFPSLPAVYFAGSKPPENVELTFWTSVKDSTIPAVLNTYLDRYPNGEFASLARSRIEHYERQLKAEQAAHEEERKRQEQALATQRAQDESAKRQLGAAKSPVAQQLSPSADAEERNAIDEEVKTAREETLKSEAQRQAALRAAEEAWAKAKTALNVAEEARMKAKKIQAPSDTSALSRDIQTELKRLGCLPGDADTAWTPKASEALARYLAAAKQPLPSEGLTTVFLEQLKRAPAQTCPSPCGSDEKVAGGNCVALGPQARPVAPPVTGRSPDWALRQECERKWGILRCGNSYPTMLGR